MTVALFGATLWIVDQDRSMLDESTQRTLAAFTVFLIITTNRHFSLMLRALSRATSTCGHIVLTICVFILVYAILSKDIYGGQVLDDNGVAYFDTYWQSVLTMYRLFVGEGWHEVMMSTTAVTSDAARFWFFTFTFIGTMFCGELMVGAITSVFADVQSIESPRLQFLLAPIFTLPPKVNAFLPYQQSHIIIAQP